MYTKHDSSGGQKGGARGGIPAVRNSEVFPLAYFLRFYKINFLKKLDKKNNPC